MTRKVEHALQELGLQPKEVMVYLALLQLGQASVQTIAQRARIRRPTAYVVLDALIQKGLAEKGFVGNHKTVFTAAPPEKLEDLIKERLRDIQDQEETFQKLLPDLRAIFALSSDRPSIRLFEGKEGLLNLQKEFIEVNGEEIVGIVSQDSMKDLFPSESEEYQKSIIDTRVKAGIPSRHLYVRSEGPIYTPEEDRKVLRQSRWIPPEKLSMKASFAVHSPLLSLVSFRNKVIGVLIEHVDIADSFKAIFEAAWDAAEKYNPPDK